MEYYGESGIKFHEIKTREIKMKPQFSAPVLIKGDMNEKGEMI